MTHTRHRLRLSAHLGLLALGHVIRMPALALQQDALLAAGVSHLYFELLTRLEDDRFFWWLTLAASGAVVLS